MTNDFSEISAESNLRDEITVRSDEYDPAAEIEPVEVDDDGLTEAERAEDRDELEMMREDESMDGDFDSGMASAGFGMDEDYGYYGGDGE